MNKMPQATTHRHPTPEIEAAMRKAEERMRRIHKWIPDFINGTGPFAPDDEDERSSDVGEPAK
ncbi:MAG: hypothetical protein PHS79_06025 [Patescibacteria group bacterium]|nr:hypothetical protein [Patescibacteria group bacterium]